MKSLRELYTVGRGPSSSHTIGPARACCLFREEHPDADRYEVALFGSLALTGRGHLTDVAVRDALAPVHTDILWNTERTDLPHPNTMELRAYKNGALTLRRRRRDLHPRPARHRVTGGLSGNELRGDFRLLQRKPAAAERLCVSAGRGGDPGLSL